MKTRRVGKLRVQLLLVDQERGNTLEDLALTILVEEDPQDRGHPGLPSRHLEVHYQSFFVRHMVKLIEGCATRPLALVITAVVCGTSLRIVLVPEDLGHPPQPKSQYKVLSQEAHSQLAEAEAEAEAEARAVPRAVRV